MDRFYCYPTKSIRCILMTQWPISDSYSSSSDNDSSNAFGGVGRCCPGVSSVFNSVSNNHILITMRNYFYIVISIIYDIYTIVNKKLLLSNSFLLAWLLPYYTTKNPASHIFLCINNYYYCYSCIPINQK